MRSASIAPNRLPAASASCPVSRSTSTTGDSGGMYQTMGSVRYSGCSGSATSNRLISAHTGERCAACTQSCGMPARSAARTTSRVGRVEEHLALGGVEVLLVRGGRRGQHAVGVVEDQADVAEPADAGLRAHGWNAD